MSGEKDVIGRIGPKVAEEVAKGGLLSGLWNVLKVGGRFVPHVFMAGQLLELGQAMGLIPNFLTDSEDEEKLKMKQQGVAMDSLRDQYLDETLEMQRQGDIASLLDAKDPRKGGRGLDFSAAKTVGDQLMLEELTQGRQETLSRIAVPQPPPSFAEMAARLGIGTGV